MSIETIRSIETLLSHLRDGGSAEYLWFWGHRRAADGSIGKSCFSQWFEAAFVIDDIRYPTAEYFMMAGKARLFGDQEVLARIIAAPTACEAKALGRKVKGFDDALDRTSLRARHPGQPGEISSEPQVAKLPALNR